VGWTADNEPVDLDGFARDEVAVRGAFDAA
jgi:hypothetical protein